MSHSDHLLNENDTTATNTTVTGTTATATSSDDMIHDNNIGGGSGGDSEHHPHTDTDVLVPQQDMMEASLPTTTATLMMTVERERTIPNETTTTIITTTTTTDAMEDDTHRNDENDDENTQPDDTSSLWTTQSPTPSATFTTVATFSLERAHEYKELGNTAFTNGNTTTSKNTAASDDVEPQRKLQFQLAIRYYTLGIEILQQSLSSTTVPLPPPSSLQQQPQPDENHTTNNNDKDNNTTNIASSLMTPNGNGTLQSDCSNLLLQLWSNRSLAYIKSHEYLLAEEDCCRILEPDHFHNTPMATTTTTTTFNNNNTCITKDPRFISKVWFRRGWAREQYAHQLVLVDDRVASIASTTTPTLDSMIILQHYLENSKRDLQQCLHVATTTTQMTTPPPMSPKEIHSLKQQVIPVVQRLAQLQKQVATVSSDAKNSSITQIMNSNHTPPRSTATASVVSVVSSSPPPPPSRLLLPPPLAQQKIHVMELLTSRANISHSILEGEAYFILDWKWWCHFCQAIQLLTPDPTMTPTSTTMLLFGLPPGATIPEPISDDDDDDDEDEEMDDFRSVPGPIDNTSLLLLLPQKQTPTSNNDKNRKADYVDRIYNKHWYRPYLLNETATTSVTEITNNNYDNNSDHGSSSTNLIVPPQSTYHPIVPLRPNLVRGYHYEIIPREVYYALRLWYTEMTPPICRRAIVKPTNGRNGSIGQEHRLCYIPLYPLSSNDSAVSAIPEPIVPVTAVSSTMNKGGTGECGNCGAMNVTLRCSSCMSIYYCDRVCQESDWHTHKNECKAMIAQQAKAGSNNKTASIPQRPVRARGRMGLNNLGNTCFMNSAIQCLSHATPLTRHFLSGRYQKDINRSNPLGTGGQLAVAYADTIKLLHHTRTTSSISPTKLKHAIAMFAPRFAGFLQHDAQEFLAYLLDGLHEDVNRIRNAPYVEMPDVTDGQCIAIAGAKAWEAHRKRNDSVVLDTFYGQFKSTCVCPKCQRVSVSFDVYNHVSLEIPQETNDNVPMVVIVYASPSITNPFPKPTRYAVSISRNTNIVSDLTQSLSAMCHIPFERLHICEEHHGTITIHEVRKPLSSFRNTVLIAYELHPLHGSSEETDPVFHAVLTNQLIVPDEASANIESPESALRVPSMYERIGIPILTSFSASYTCREVWNHIWSLLQYYVTRKEVPPDDPTQPSEMDITNHFDVRNMLQIRLVVQSNGNERLVFPTVAGENAHDSALNRSDANPADEMNDDEIIDPAESEIVQKSISYTSILPKDSDETLLKYVGIDQLRNFVYFDCVWLTPEMDANNEPASGDEKIDATPTATPSATNAYSIDEDRFYSVTNHSSYLEYIKKSKEVSSKRAVTLDECFDTFTRPERLDIQNMWYCSHCKDHVQALKTMELWKLPNVLIIHLKRFEYKHSLRRDKLDHLVDFPLYGLDMNQHCGKYNHDNKTNACVDSYVPALYDCFAVVNHYGRMGFGHYTAYARAWNEQGFVSSTSTTNEASTPDDWNLFDDSQVRRVHDERSVVSSAAYVLLYRRRIFH